MRVVLSGGGTAGHINPALALAEVLSEHGHEVFFAGTPQGVEARLVREAGIPFSAFEAAGFNRNHPASIFKAVLKILKSTGAAKKWFADIKPDVVVGFGGYVCIPVGRAAESMGIPVVVHEQNSVMGMANKYLGKRAAAVALTYEVAGEPIADKSKLVVTGNPVRRSVLSSTREESRRELGIPQDALMLLVFGGSLGARHINTAVCGLKERLLSVENLHVMHVTGPERAGDRAGGARPHRRGGRSAGRSWATRIAWGRPWRLATWWSRAQAPRPWRRFPLGAYRRCSCRSRTRRRTTRPPTRVRTWRAVRRP